MGDGPEKIKSESLDGDTGKTDAKDMWSEVSTAVFGAWDSIRKTDAGQSIGHVITSIVDAASDNKTTIADGADGKTNAEAEKFTKVWNETIDKHAKGMGAPLSILYKELGAQLASGEFDQKKLQDLMKPIGYLSKEQMAACKEMDMDMGFKLGINVGHTFMDRNSVPGVTVDGNTDGMYKLGVFVPKIGDATATSKRSEAFSPPAHYVDVEENLQKLGAYVRHRSKNEL